MITISKTSNDRYCIYLGNLPYLEVDRTFKTIDTFSDSAFQNTPSDERIPIEHKVEILGRLLVEIHNELITTRGLITQNETKIVSIERVAQVPQQTDVESGETKDMSVQTQLNDINNRMFDLDKRVTETQGMLRAEQTRIKELKEHMKLIIDKVNATMREHNKGISQLSETWRDSLQKQMKDLNNIEKVLQKEVIQLMDIIGKYAKKIDAAEKLEQLDNTLTLPPLDDTIILDTDNDSSTNN